MKVKILPRASRPWLMALAMACAVTVAQADGAPQPLRWRLAMPPPASAKAASAPVLPMVPNGCAQTREQWEVWRDTTIRYLLQLHKPTAEERNSGLLSPYLNRDEVSTRSSFIVEALDQCAAAKMPAPEAILGNLVRFVRAQHNANYQLPNPQHQFGHGPELTDEDYLCKAQQALDLPCLLKSPQFLGHLQRQRDYGKAQALIQKQNRGEPLGIEGCTPDGQQWDTLFYRSRLLTTPDDAQALGRFLVVVPAQAADKDTGYDRWIQFGIWAPGRKGSRPPGKLQNVSVVAVSRVPDPADGQALPAGSFDAMTDWFRCTDKTCGPGARASDGATLARNACMKDTPDPKPKLQLKYRLAVSGESEDCQRCHKHMPVGIHPAQVFTPARSGHLTVLKPDAAASAAVAAINDRFVNDDAYQRLARYMVNLTDTVPGAANASDKWADWRNNGEFGFGASPEHFEDRPGNRPFRKRDPNSIKECAKPAHLTVDQIKRVSSAMKCDACHHARSGGSTYGVLNYPLATDLRLATAFNSKAKLAPNLIRSHIQLGVMPLEEDDTAGTYALKPVKLSDKERAVLYRCLSREYFNPHGPAAPSGLFVDWLRMESVPSTLKAVALNTVAALAPPPAAALKPVAALHWAKPASAAPGAPVPTPETLYGSRCGQCHFPKKTRGPSLAGILGRTLAADSAFARYSDGLKLLGSQGEKWTEDMLMDFLKDPDEFIKLKAGTAKGSAMAKRVDEESIRRAIVKHLATL